MQTTHRRGFLKTVAATAFASGLLAGPAEEMRAAPEPQIPGRGFAQTPARGPLTIHPANSRYFTDGSGQAVFLTGSYTLASLQNAGNPPLRPFNWREFLDMLQDHNHNCTKLEIRLQPEEASQVSPELQFSPSPYLRTGPGTTLGRKPGFDLSRFNQEFFDRLRSRTIEAGDRGIYVSIPLFPPAGSTKARGPCGPWSGAFYDTNRFSEERNETSQLKPDRPEVRSAQAAYMRKLIDTVNDLDNILYEVASESGRTDWNRWVVDFVQAYERDKGKSHPVGLTGAGAVSLSTLLDSSADWVGVSWNEGQPTTDFPPWDGRKVSILEPDHVEEIGDIASRVWKSFLQGYNTRLMDPWMSPAGRLCADENSTGQPNSPERELNRHTRELARMAMGNARAYALRVNLTSMIPQGELASTGYCLANPPWEYLVYLPEGGELKLDLSAAPGPLSVEWMHSVQGTIVRGRPIVGGKRASLFPPFSGAAVLYLRRS